MQRNIIGSLVALGFVLAFAAAPAFCTEAPSLTPDLEPAAVMSTNSEVAETAAETPEATEASAIESPVPVSTEAGGEIPQAGGSCVPGGACWSHDDCGGIPVGWCYKFSKTCWCS